MSRCLRKTISMIIVLAIILTIIPVQNTRAEDSDFVIEDGKLMEYNGDEYSVIIPNNVIAIDDYAFVNSYYLKEITIPYNVESIGKYAFEGCGSLEKIIVDIDNAVYSSYDGCLYDKEKTQLLVYPKNKKSLNIAEGVQKLNFDFLSGNYYSIDVTIPKSLTEINISELDRRN